jgi:homoserine kinase type II
MAVFTPVSIDDLAHWADQYDIGKVLAVKGISSGIENSNFFVSSERNEYVLTVFEKLGFEQLPFYLKLMRHVAERGVLVPLPIANRQGELLSSLHGKPAALVTKLEGACQMAPAPKHCAEVGAMLAKLHLAAADYPLFQPNLRGLDWWRETTPVVLPFLPPPQQQLLRDELAFQEAHAAGAAYARLPRGPVHADLFRNNVMFDGERLTGFFDFYFAGVDTWLFDVAVTVNDWCINEPDGALDPERTRALLGAYNALRPFSDEEAQAWRTMLRAGALRFWLSRLYDLHLPRDAEILTPHDPAHFERILRERIAQPIPPLV